jgi:uncharacterized protein YndB with AHSA1/START domain
VTSISKRTDTASRFIRASPERIYRALASAEAWISWLPPQGMEARIHEFDFRTGGSYHMELIYAQPDHIAGKTSAHSDVVRGRFVELVPEKRVVQMVEFDSDNSAFAGAMKMTWSLTPVSGGTEVTIRCENVPEGIRQEDHDQGLRSTLANLASFTE